jgi:dynein heavy chain
MLKKSNQGVPTDDDGFGGKKQSNQNIFRIKESAYEALGFSDNMSYEKRSELRKECSKFLRFAYLVDFMAMQALSNIFVLSVQELEDKIRKLGIYLIYSDFILGFL